MRRFVLELSERMGCTAAELGERMSLAELTERLALAEVHDQERRVQRKG